VEPGSPFMGVSQPGQLTLHRTRQGLMPPRPNLDQVVSSVYTSNPWQVNPDSSVQAHTEGCEGNLPIGTQI
jgi:hypothetical protein